MVIRTNQPQMLSRPMSRQAFRPGEWNGVRVGGGNRTYIQNNFYGECHSYRGWDSGAWAAYEQPCCDCDQGNSSNSSNKVGVLGWVGLGVGALGGILGCIFGSKAKETSERGGVEEPDQPLQPKVPAQQDEVDELDGKDQPVQPAKTSQSQQVVAPKPQVVAEQPKTAKDIAIAKQKADAQAINNFDWNSGFETSVRDVKDDDTNATEAILGKVNVTDKDYKKGSAPKTFTITDTGGVYTFEKVETKDGTVKYKCTNQTSVGNKTAFTKGNVYTCEILNGKPVFKQHSWDEGGGKGLFASNQ